MARPFPKSPSYQTTMSGLLRMHQLSLAHEEETKAADLVRESMNDAWEGLSKVEKARFTGLSKDLYAISDETPQDPEPINPQVQRKLFEAYEAREKDEWDKALELLRRWGKYIPAGLVSHLRGTIWSAAGEPAVAVVFYEYALKLEPANGNYEGILLDSLKIANPVAAKERAEAILAVQESKTPAVVLQAADILFGLTESLSESDSAPIYHRLIPILEGIAGRIEGVEDFDKASLVGMLETLLALIYKDIGNTRKAYEHYSSAIEVKPSNDALLVARGILMYGTDSNAVDDFEQAIRLGTPIIWPYFFLAHYYLDSGRLEECRLMCDRALRKTAPQRVQSELYGFLGIALAGLEAHESSIRKAFENAIRIDESNERARANLKIFLEGLATRTTHKQWNRVSTSSMRGFERRQTRNYLGLKSRRPALV